MPSIKHVHQYVLYKNRSKGKPFRERIYQCASPHCSHYKDVEQLLGKASVCNTCGAEFILDRTALTLVKPKCLMCSESKKGKAAQAAKQILGNLESILNPATDGMDEGIFDD